MLGFGEENESRGRGAATGRSWSEKECRGERGKIKKKIGKLRKKKKGAMAVANVTYCHCETDDML